LDEATCVPILDAAAAAKDVFLDVVSGAAVDDDEMAVLLLLLLDDCAAFTRANNDDGISDKSSFQLDKT
jgi:hypothetical protein